MCRCMTGVKEGVRREGKAGREERRQQERDDGLLGHSTVVLNARMAGATPPRVFSDLRPHLALAPVAAGAAEETVTSSSCHGMGL